MNRRKFITWVGLGAIASNLPIAIAASSFDESQTISQNPNFPLDNTPTPEGFIPIGSIQQLDRKGQIIKDSHDAIIFRNPENSDIIAFNSICTHEGCSVEWDKTDGNLVCPCHRSKFNSEGQVLNGPARFPLDKLEVKEDKGIIFLKVA